eukprot:TRINITY_DN91757_c0_g1_i1.p1 TRINITY_DN91757_c0_g1~~TRINITY_DN91757_c0_g1_i1.p1  ORF type:complete len:619 (-),score=131.42 TRINITY_DN91757_c0_g1_i1:44-1900(-)
MVPMHVPLLALTVFVCVRGQEPVTAHTDASVATEESVCMPAAEQRVLLARLQALEEQVASCEGAAASNLEDDKVPAGSTEFWQIVAMVVTTLCIQAVANGLTMGLVSIDPMEMEIIVRTEEKDILHKHDQIRLQEDQAAAMTILPLIQDHHLIMVTVLLVNCLCGEVLPLFLDQLVPSWLSLLFSVTLVLFFSEIIPSAIFTGHDQLKLAAKFAPLLAVFKCVLCPISWPIARGLDHLLGTDHKGRYNFAELRAIVGMHAKLNTGGEPEAVFKAHDEQCRGIITTHNQHRFTSQSVVIFTGAPKIPAVSSKLIDDGTPYYVKPCAPVQGRNKDFTFKLYTSPERKAQHLVTYEPGELTSGVFKLQERDELKIMNGAMTLAHTTASDVMVPMNRVTMLECTAPLNHDRLREIDKMGFSRLPVYERSKHNIRGFFLVKSLIRFLKVGDEHDSKCVGSMQLRDMVLATPDINLLDLLNKFQEEKCHIALVTNNPDAVRQAWGDGSEIPPDVHMAGMVTLEDVIEKLLQEDIDDEHDARQQRNWEFTPRALPRVVSGEEPFPPPGPTRAKSCHLLPCPPSNKEKLAEKATERPRRPSDRRAMTVGFADLEKGNELAKPFLEP